MDHACTMRLLHCVRFIVWAVCEDDGSMGTHRYAGSIWKHVTVRCWWYIAWEHVTVVSLVGAGPTVLGSMWEHLTVGCWARATIVQP